MKAVIALDLDQTLIYSVRSAGLVPGPGTVWVEDYQGAPLSLMTRRAHTMLGSLSSRHHVVPVTTRTLEQYARVRLPGPLHHVICANGGILLVDGVRDRDWDDRVSRTLQGSTPLAEVGARLEAVADEPWVKTVASASGLFLYLVAQHRDHIPRDWLDGVTDWSSGVGWGVSVQGRKVYLVPHGLTKAAAAVHLCDRLGGPLLAAGDSLLDLPLLQAAAFAARPPHGELSVGVPPAGVVVTSRPGAVAAEDLLLLLAARADGPAPCPGAV